MAWRTADISDASSLVAISIEVWIGTYIKSGVSPFFADYVLREFTIEKMEQMILAPEQLILVSENGDGVDGYIRVSSASKAPVSGCSDMEIGTLYVQPRHHGRGTGKMLLDAALGYCRQQRASSVWLATNSENGPAINFYRGQGFKQVGETYFRIDDQEYLNNVYSLRLI